MEIRDWVIPRQKIICTSTTAAHMDPTAWNTGLNNEHPVDQFWAGRFLKCPTHKREESQTGRGTDTKNSAFSLKEVEGSWIPYGGGPRQCPGRQFAKRQILLTAALFVTLFDCEILGDGRDVKEDLRSFSMGVAHPASKVLFKIRRRPQAMI
jgi:cytochrome P450